jgi:3-isopropylmalate/(R)-2-methylmalate dehydratase small subunit
MDVVINILPTARVWVFGDSVDTDQLAPGAYMKFGIDVIAAHCMEGQLPEFAAAAKPGDIAIAGRNFGCGSSREQAVAALKHLGIAAVIAQSFAGLFYRNTVNLGLLALRADDALTLADDAISAVDPRRGEILSRSGRVACDPVPEFLLDIIAAGGLLPHLKLRAMHSYGNT